MKIILKSIFASACFSALLFAIQIVNAQDRSYVYDNVKVDINIEKNSEVTVQETLTYEFTGTFRGVFREITLQSDADRIRCQNDPDLQCGGFDRLELLDVYDNNGNKLPENEYSVEEIYNETYQENRLKITWVFDEAGRSFDTEKFDFGLKYKVYKSIGSFKDYDLFYWNALFPDREVNIKSSEVNIHFPAAIDFKEADLRVLAGDFEGYDYLYQYFKENNRLNITAENIYPGQDFTILYKLPKGLVDQPPKVEVIDGGHESKLKFFAEDRQLEYVPPFVEFDSAGKYRLEVNGFGYTSQTFELDLQPGEVETLEVKLQPTLFGIIIYYGLLLVNCLSALAIPGAVLYVFFHWRKKGRDKGSQRSIMPIFEPPNDIKSYMLGSIKDEKVDMVDISSVIIDLAYRGYIKIKEISKKGFLSTAKYEFIKLKADTGLTDAEKKIMSGIFKSNDTVTTDDLQNRFYTYIPGIQDKVYDEMTEAKYFEANPQSVRSGYVLKGIGLAILGGFVIISTGVFLLTIHYLLAFVPIWGAVLVVCGLGFLIIANFMPAKTEFGRETLEQIMGFRMFMYHAERYRLQKLTPDMFEKYLSYAVVFGLEKQWGEAFKDIYKGSPGWFEGSDSNINSILLANSLSNMMNSTSTVLASSPSSSSSHSGGGWSGGGGFSGGFSGGGGGGGGGGAF